MSVNRTVVRTAAVALLMSGFCALAQSPSASAAKTSLLPYQDTSLPTEQRVNDLVGRMTLDEKAQQLVNSAPAIPRLGVPEYDYWSEGLHGIARSGYATLFPQAVGMAATFDEPLLHQIGEVVSTEARAKYNDSVAHGLRSIFYGLTIWSPNINIFRDPRWGRGQETYGEDPFLTARLGTAFVKGLQGDDPNYYRTIATPKHYAVHSGPESERHRFNVDPSAHDLWDTYLPAFRATIVEGKADSIMCAYNAIDGKPACASDLLLGQVLRDDWGFKGFVTSDCGAIDNFYEKDGHKYSKDAEHASVDGIRAGTDTNCGGTYRNLADAVHKGLIQESELDVSLRRLFLARFKLGLFDPPSKVKYASMPITENMSPAHTELALRTAREAMVLLKNEHHTLPLDAHVKTIAVIGPNASSLSAVEGNYNAIPKDPVMPVDGIVREFSGAKVLYAQGSPYAEGAAVVVPRTQFRTAPDSQEEGLKAEYFNNDSLQGPPAFRRVDRQLDFDWDGASPVPGVNMKAFSVRWTGTLQVPAPGDYQVSPRNAQWWPVNGAEKFTIKFDGKDFGSSVAKLHFDDTRPHAIEITYSHKAELFGGEFSLRWTPPVEPLRAQAMEAVKRADVVVAFVGLSPELEGEEMKVDIPGFSGGDRVDLGLPPAQQQLLEAAKATGKPLVVVLLNGSALAVNWAQENADAILEAWYPGQAGAQAIADTLSGKNNPSGRLPVTFYRSANDLPPFTDYSMANRTYRYFTGKPLYEFGYGLSYSTFSYSNVHLSKEHLDAGDTLHVEADVKNTSTRAGDEVAEVYLTPPQDGVNPLHSLEGFEHVHLLPGASKHVSFTLDPRQLSEVDAKGVRAVRAGEYSVTVGGGQPGVGKDVSAQFTIEGSHELPR
jgi:beta-glucosidase